MAFDYTVRMRDNGLATAVDFVIIFDSDLVLINQVGMLRGFNEAASRVFGTLFKEFATPASTGFIMLHLGNRLSVFLGIPIAFGG